MATQTKTADAATRKRRTRSSKVRTTTSRARTGTTSGSTKRSPILPEDLKEFRFVGSPQISPDGERVVFVRKHVGDKNEYVANLWIVDSRGGGAPMQFTSGAKDGMPRWSPDGSRIAFLSGRDKPRQQVFTIPVDGGEATALTSLPEGAIRDLRWSPDGKTIAIAFRETAEEWTTKAIEERKEKGLTDPPRVLDDWWYRLDGDGYFDAQRFHLCLIDVETGEHRCVYTKDRLGFFDFDFGPDSKRIVISANRDRKAMVSALKTNLEVLDLKSGKVKVIQGPPPGPKAAVRWSPDGKWFAYAGREGRDSTYSTENLELWVCDASTGKARSLTSTTDYCMLAAALTDSAEVAFAPTFEWAPDSKRIFVKLGWHGESHVASVAVRNGETSLLTTGVYDHDLGNVSSDGKTIAMLRSEPTVLPEVYRGDVSASKITTAPLSHFNHTYLQTRTTARVTSHWVKTADGTKVQVWVMMPPGFKRGSRKKYPGVLEIHGGPHAQYGVGFFHEFQVLASAGYVVVYSNPRGSKGYGRDHCHAIRGNWGTADWVDIQAVRDFMLEHPNIDSKCMGVMGGSYGGYMTNWVIGNCHDFAGAITDRCVSNLVSMGGSSDFVDAPDDYFPGNFWDRPDERWEQSPIRHFGKVKTPTLVIHSEGDLRCNIEQAEQVFSALKLNNVPTRFVRYPRTTSHGMSRGGPPDMRLHRLHQILNWWTKYLRK